MSGRAIASAVRAALGRPAVRLLVSAAILALLFLKLPLADFLRAFRQVSLSCWLIAAGLFLAGHGVGAYKWRLVVLAGDAGFSLRQALRCHFVGLFANLFLPSVAGGEAVRLAMALGHTRARGAAVLASAVDRLLDVASLVLFALLATLLGPGELSGSHRTALAAAGLALALGTLASAGLLRFPSVRFLPEALGSPLSRLRDSASRMTHMPARLACAFGLTVLVQAGFVWLNARLGAEIGIAVPLAVWFSSWSLAKLAATLPISLGGLGVREAALAALLGRHGVPAALSVAQGLVWQVVLASGSVVGAVLYGADRRSGSDCRSSPADAP